MISKTKFSFLERISTLFFTSVRSTSGAATSREFLENGLVRDGTPCGRNLVCVNQTCVSLFPYIDQTKCPTNSNNVECYGQGVSIHTNTHTHTQTYIK